jgi:uncharacterized protein
MLPYFRSGDYSGGLVSGVEAIRSVLNGSELDTGGNDDYISSEEEPVFGIIAFFALMMIGGMVILYLAIRASQRCPNCKEIALQKDSARVISRNFGATTYEDTYICAKCGTVVKRKRQDYDSSHNNRGGGGPIIMGGGGFGRGGGGSFGGGWGGGSFGGGGAGSRW